MATAKKTTPAVAEAAKKPVAAKPAVTPSTTTKSVAVTKKAAAKKATAKTPEVVSKPVRKAATKAAEKPTATKKAPPIAKPLDPAQRAHYVEVAAFYIAERRGFSAANPMDDWLAAEAEIDRLIASGHFGN